MGILSAGLSFSLIVLCSPYALVVFLPSIPVYVWLQQMFRATARETRRIASVTRSPVFNSFNEALNGISTIRAFQKMDYFFDMNDRRLETNLNANLAGFFASMWLSLRMSIISTTIVSSVIIFSLIEHIMGWDISGLGYISGKKLSAGIVGLSLSLCFKVSSQIENVIQIFTNTELSLVSMERLLALRDLNPEAELITPEDMPESSWPSGGSVEFIDVSMRYRKELPLAIREVNFTVPAGSSLGIVGRTGAGKTTIINALFRLNELDGGSVLIDGVDISTLGLHTLRSRIAIIPQDPVLFAGSMRSNLDPFSMYDDADLWLVLQRVQLNTFVRDRGGLSMNVSTGGSNVSVGQRQLVCLARALLRKAQILVLDEATASVDPETDSAIQSTLSALCEADTTVLTIAHRIGTIVGNDFALVMDKGRVAEFGRTNHLLADAAS